RSVSPTTAPPPPDLWVLAAIADLIPRDARASLEECGEGSLWKRAVDAGLVSDTAILEALSARTHVGIANGLLVSSQALELVPERLARRFSILPLTVSDTTLEIATANPYDLDCEQVLAFAAGRSVRMLLAPPDKILDRIEEVYAPVDRVNKLLERPRSAVPSVVEKVEDAEQQLDEKEAERPVIKLVDHIVAEGIAAGASDIHLEAGETGIAVRYRIDGM